MGEEQNACNARKGKGDLKMTESERREAEIRSIMKLTKSGEAKKEEKKAPKRQSKGAKK